MKLLTSILAAALTLAGAQAAQPIAPVVAATPAPSAQPELTGSVRVYYGQPAYYGHGYCPPPQVYVPRRVYRSHGHHYDRRRSHHGHYDGHRGRRGHYDGHHGDRGHRGHRRY